ncbi:MAG: GNAT family N-acetyltransferase [Firmicutes bacterium]|nr:GNAT family N-acetyltransferase [Bacillota bacterium]
MQLETPRLILREIRKTDFAAIHSMGSNPANVVYMAWGPNGEEQTRGFIAYAMKAAKAEPRVSFHFAVTLKPTGQIIGTCDISQEKDWHGRRFICGGLGWILHMDHWKQGYGTELAAALIRFGFEELDLHRIRVSCDGENYGSYRVMERNGMRREAVFRQAILGRDGTWHDQYEYAILRDEWAQTQEKE